MLVVSWFISGIIYFFLYSYLFCKMVCKQRYVINVKNIIFAIIVASIQAIIIKLDIGYIRPYVMHLLYLLMLMILYKNKLGKTLIGILYTLMIVCFSELIFSIILLSLRINIEKLVLNYIFHFLSNVIILFISLLIFKIKFITALFMGIIRWYDDSKYASLVLFIIFALTINIFILYNNFINVLPNSILLLTNLFCIAVFVFVVGFFKEKTSKNKVIYEYDQLLDYVKIYENLLDEKSKNLHEYKNQLVIIKNMAKTKKEVKYIDSIINEDFKDNDLDNINKLKYIPKGGLKGLIFYKIETMKKKKLTSFIHISSELENHKLWKKCDKYLNDISKVLGVYIDNAIEATEESKNKCIIFEAFLEDENIVFQISNTYKDEINLSKIDKEGYTTKGIGKGYGLSLVKEIIAKNDCLEQSRSLNLGYYVQKLYIKK